MGLQTVFPNKHSCIPLVLDIILNFGATFWSIVTHISFSECILGLSPAYLIYTIDLTECSFGLQYWSPVLLIDGNDDG